jgi:hypothetical protein
LVTPQKAYDFFRTVTEKIPPAHSRTQSHSR